MTDLHKLTGAYAMDALDDLERARFERHLAECDDCRAEVAELTETAALLAETVATPAPDSLRGSVLRGISQVRPLPPEVPEAPASPDTETPALTTAAPRRRAWMPLLVAAALAVLLGVGAMIVRPWTDHTPDQLSAADQVIRAADAQEVFLDLGEAGRATVVRSKAENKAVITTEGMVSAPAGKAYELWFINGDEFTSAGLMPDAPNQTLVLDGAAADADAVGITVEPTTGSEQPTSDPIAVFDLTRAA